MGDLSPHFSSHEFFSKDTFRVLAYSHDPKWHIDPRLMSMLEEIRGHFGVPVTISDRGGYRSAGENHTAGGAKNSFHLEGKAADIKVDGIDPDQVQEYCMNKFKYGGLGLGKTFTHIDCRNSESQITWSYS